MVGVNLPIQLESIRKNKVIPNCGQSYKEDNRDAPFSLFSLTDTLRGQGNVIPLYVYRTGANFLAGIFYLKILT